MGSKITEDGDCSHDIKRHLFLGGKAMTNLDSVLKNRDTTLPIKVHMYLYLVKTTVKAVVFPAVMCEYGSWIKKKAEL